MSRVLWDEVVSIWGLNPEMLDQLTRINCQRFLRLRPHLGLLFEHVRLCYEEYPLCSSVGHLGYHP
jgi:hypothetical protein